MPATSASNALTLQPIGPSTPRSTSPLSSTGTVNLSLTLPPDKRIFQSPSGGDNEAITTFMKLKGVAGRYSWGDSIRFSALALKSCFTTLSKDDVDQLEFYRATQKVVKAYQAVKSAKASEKSFNEVLK
ncbi:MAG: hypothetical protein ACRENF_04540, partial [Thermodesulfobacteriota bacterium]